METLQNKNPGSPAPNIIYFEDNPIDTFFFLYLS